MNFRFAQQATYIHKLLNEFQVGDKSVAILRRASRAAAASPCCVDASLLLLLPLLITLHAQLSLAFILKASVIAQQDVQYAGSFLLFFLLL